MPIFHPKQNFVDETLTLIYAGTFDFKNIQVSTNSSGSKVQVSCGFIEGSKAAGALVIAYSATNVSDIHYEVIPRNSQQRVEATLSCLPGEKYNVLLFVINETGLPVSNAATQPFTRSINTTQSDTHPMECKQALPKLILKNMHCISHIPWQVPD